MVNSRKQPLGAAVTLLGLFLYAIFLYACFYLPLGAAVTLLDTLASSYMT
jgi:hypothetical protein